MTNRYFSQKQIEGMCVKFGFSQSEARIASAIAMVEAPAAGRPGFADALTVGDQNLANSTWGYSYGLFQVRSLRAQKNTGRERDETMLSDPEFNCYAAFVIYSKAGNRFTPWSTYTSNQYKAYLPELFPPEPGTYTVVAGDTLNRIAQKIEGVTWQDLARLNGLVSPYTIYIGQSLRLPFDTYTVRPGDNLSVIAARVGGVTWQEIAHYNNLSNPNLIYPDQKLRIPR